MSLSVNTRSVGAIQQKYNHNTIARKLVGNYIEVKIICRYIFCDFAIRVVYGSGTGSININILYSWASFEPSPLLSVRMDFVNQLAQEEIH